MLLVYSVIAVTRLLLLFVVCFKKAVISEIRKWMRRDGSQVRKGLDTHEGVKTVENFTKPNAEHFT